jgi:hypothetical protein
LKYINIKAPKSIEDLRIRHLEALTTTKYNLNNMNIQDIVKFLTHVTNATENELKKVMLNDLKVLLNHVVKIFSDFKPSKPKEKITIDGKVYELVDPSKVGIGWHIDVSNSDFKKDPSRLAALMYIEKGTKYGELDENLNMVYSNQERAKIFEQHLPLPDYLNVVDFFLRQSIESISNYTENKIVRKSLLKAVRGMFGKN